MAFDAYNRRDSADLLTLLTDDVRWPGNCVTLQGKAQVQHYLEDQWVETVTFDEVLAVEEQTDGYVVAFLDQVVRSLDGKIISTAKLKYGFVVEHRKIAELRTRNA